MATEEKKQQALEDLGIIYLSGRIDDAKSEQICKQIIELNARTLDCIQLIINSAGGGVHAGFALLDVMEWSRLPVRTTALGMVASMALLVFMAGEKGHRVVTPRVAILSHRYWWWNVGNHSELIARRKEEDLTHRRILEHYARHTRLKTEEALHEKLLRDVDAWLTADEAVECGIADIVENRGRPT
jgi:ATP-dependent Clp protease protease subunit